MIPKIKITLFLTGMLSLFLFMILIPFSHSQEFDWSLKATALTQMNGVAGSSQNPGNRFATISDMGMILAIKPDLSLAYEDWQFMAKPRLEFEMNGYTIDGQTSDSSEASADIIEFKLMHPLSENLFFSYGWENLQWGPSFLYSPSNPFFNDNGKKNLVQEIEGKGFLKLILVHDFSWSSSLIINTDKGAFNEADFEKTYALKIDYSGDTSYASVILSRTDNRETRLGGFAGTTLTDAVIIYGEANFQQGTYGLFPKAIPGPLAWEINPSRENDDTLYATLLTGASYTFESGDTVTAEYLYYGQGYDSDEVSDFNALKTTAQRFYASSTALSGYGTRLLGNAATTHLDFLRKNYVMLQYVNEDIVTDLDLVSRVTFCLDDRSSQLYASLSHDLNDHIELKASGMINTGGSNASFGIFLDHQVQMAVEYIF